MLTPEQIEQELQAAVDAVRAAATKHEPQTRQDLVAIMLAATLGRALDKEIAMPMERVKQIFGQVVDLDEAIRAAAATGAAEQLDVWWESLRKAVHQRIDSATQPRELFAFVFDFASGTALGTGLSPQDATAIVARCAQQIADATAAAPPAAPPRRYSAPTG